MNGTDAVEAGALIVTPVPESGVVEPMPDPADLAEFWRLYHDILARRWARQKGES